MLIELSLMVLNLTSLLFVLSPDSKIVETSKLKGKLTKILIFLSITVEFFQIFHK
jgi:cytochrome c oxidase subunit IV